MFVANDVFFLGSHGIRSLRARDLSLTAAVADVGSPLDPVIQNMFAQQTAGVHGERASGAGDAHRALLDDLHRTRFSCSALTRARTSRPGRSTCPVSRHAGPATFRRGPCSQTRPARLTCSAARALRSYDPATQTPPHLSVFELRQARDAQGISGLRLHRHGHLDGRSVLRRDADDRACHGTRSRWSTPRR